MGKIKFQPMFIVYVFLCIYFHWFNGIFYYTVTVVLHEYGHLIVARLLGYETNGITFNVYGAGLNTNNAYKKKDDVLISLAGPCVNLIIIIIIVCGWWFFPSTYLFTKGFFDSNLIIMCFNLIPIYPLDGGRVIFALITNKTSRRKVLKINNIICFCLGLCFLIIFAISWFYKVNYNLLFIGLFLTGNSIIYDKSGYYSKVKSFAKDREKTIEVKLFKVNNFDDTTLIKHLSPHYYSLFLTETPKGYKIKKEDDILNT